MRVYVATHAMNIAGKHVVFGAVSSGMDLVKKIEGFGSQSGKPSKKITIADSGELPQSSA